MTSPFFLCIIAVLMSCSGQPATPQLINTKSDPHLKIANGDTVKELGKSIMMVYQDKKNNYWFGSWGEGLYRYDGKTMLHFTTEDGLSQNKIASIQEDQAGNIYFNTDVGISKFDGTDFTTLSITGNEWKLQPDDLWFTGAQDSAVVYRYDGKDLHRLKFPETKAGDEYNAQFPRSTLAFPYSPYDVYTIYSDSKGNIWFGTSCLGVCRYDGETFTWISEEELEFDVETAFGIRSIVEDNDGKFWFSNTLHRFIMFEDGKYIKENGIQSLDDDKSFEAIISIAKDGDDLWLVTYNAGVWRYSGENLTHYPVMEGDQQIKLYSIFKDNRGELWLGTHENGTYQFNGKTFERFRPL